MSQSTPPARPTTTGRPVRPEADRPGNPRLLTPGSVVRVPVGFVWIGIVAVVILLIGAYWLGSRRGFDDGRAEGQQVVKSLQEVERTANTRREPGSAASESTPTRRPRARNVVQDPSPVVASASTGMSRSRPKGAENLDRSVDVQVERREDGWSYMVVLYTKLDSARAVAESIRENGKDLGVDAMVEPSNNGRLASVILLPGSPGPFSAAEQTAWDRRIDELAERIADDPIWRGKRPLKGYYAESFDQ